MSHIRGLNRARWRPAPAEDAAFILDLALQEELRQGTAKNSLARAAEAADLAAQVPLPQALGLLLKGAQVAAWATERADDEAARCCGMLLERFFSHLFPPEPEIQALKQVAEHLRVRWCLNRGEVAQAREWVGRLERYVILYSGAGAEARERIDNDAANVSPETWLLTAEVGLAEKNPAAAQEALAQAQAQWQIGAATPERAVVYELLTALTQCARGDAQGAAGVAYLYRNYVLAGESVALDVAWRGRIAAAAGWLAEAVGVSRLEAARWRAWGPPETDLVTAYAGLGLLPPVTAPALTETEAETLLAGWNETPARVEEVSWDAYTPALQDLLAAESVAEICQHAYAAACALDADEAGCWEVQHANGTRLAVSGALPVGVTEIMEGQSKAGPLMVLWRGRRPARPSLQAALPALWELAGQRLRSLPAQAGAEECGSLPDFIAADPLTRQLLAEARSFAVLDGTKPEPRRALRHVLVTGERGSGKERIAQLLHEWSGRAQRPFLALDAGAFSTPELFLAELFGAAKGAYTGAVAERPGLVAQAAGGTLFLDEIDEAAFLQPGLKRLAQFGTYKQVGRAATRQADVRLIAATNRFAEPGAVKDDVRERFLEIRVPPLRARRGDIRPLAAHFTARYRIALPEPALAYLEGLEWPGNVRQLQFTLERACHLARGPEEVTLDLLAECVTRTGGAYRVAGRRAAPDPTQFTLLPGETLDERLALLEKGFLETALARTAGNKKKAAELLGWTRPRLYARAKTLGVDLSSETPG